MGKGKAPPVPYTTEWVSRNVAVVRCDFEKTTDEFWFLLTSDVHWDNRHCDRKMFRRHLREMKERRAGWIDNGDLMCLMQGKWDPRSDQTQLRKEHKGNNYLDLVRNTLADELSPYAKNIIALGHGNHETNCINRNGTDMTERVCARLEARRESPAHTCGISGWFQFRCLRGRQSDTITLYRHHGYGGGAPVTRGVIQTNRIAVQVPDANIVLTGHDHNDWIVSVPRIRLSSCGVIRKDEQLHVRAPGYKDGIGDGFEGWENVKGHQVKSKGAIWLRVWFRNRRFRYEARRAK